MPIIRKISGNSMMPHLRPGKLVLARRSSNYEAGDLIIFTHNCLEKIKRVSYFIGDIFYVLGDNLENSTDSRVFGNIDKSDILGKVIWPINKNKETHENISTT